MEELEHLSKVPEVTLIFWIIKILATTLGETGGDAVSMSMNLGYLIGTSIFAVIFIAAVVVQSTAKKFHPVIYWTTIVATATVGTTLADFADRSLGIGYAGGTAILFGLLMASLFISHRSMGQLRLIPSARRNPRCFTGSRSCSLKPLAPLLEIGRRITRAWGTAVVPLCSAQCWRQLQRRTTGRRYPTRRCFGRRLFLRDRLVRLSAILSTSHWIMAA